VNELVDILAVIERKEAIRDLKHIQHNAFVSEATSAIGS
jgi:hypothetical protein